jgi:hypothetical protein
VLPVAIRTSITPFETLLSPTFNKLVLRSVVNNAPLPGAGGGVPPGLGVGSSFFEPLHDTRLQPVQASNTPKPNFDKNSSLSIVLLNND